MQTFAKNVTLCLSSIGIGRIVDLMVSLSDNLLLWFTLFVPSYLIFIYLFHFIEKPDETTKNISIPS